VAGVSTFVTSPKYGMSRRVIFRHMKNDVTPEKAEYLADIPLAKLAERATEESSGRRWVTRCSRRTRCGIPAPSRDWPAK
jgi:hypothetical protein